MTINKLWVSTAIWVLTGFFTASTYAQTQSDDGFEPRSPIGYPILFSGSFGELRSNHFHAGVDIKSSKWNQSGDPIYAVEDGFVSRINVRGGGYGKALYIDHPGGYTTVYGHMAQYIDTLQNYVKSQQYKLKRFSVNLFPDSTLFRVKKGQVIGYMGNTGRSAAPHLHFEIRHTKSEKPLNPLYFGIGPKDTRSPTLQNLNIVHLLPDTTIVDRDRIEIQFLKNGSYQLPSDTLSINAWRVGIEINGFDRMNGASNKNGIFELQMKVNGELAYHYKMDSFSFDEFRHLNAHINYKDFDEMKRRYQRCYVLPADPLSIYEEVDTSLMIIPLYANQKQHIEIIASDFYQNSSRLEFWLKRKSKMSPPPPLHYNYKLKEGKPHLINKEEYILFFPDSSLYQNTYLHVKMDEQRDYPLASKQLFINSDNIFKNPVDLFIRPEGIADSLLEKAVIVSCDGPQLTSYGGEIFEQFITTKIQKYGNYAVFLDTIPPTLTPLLFSPGLNYSKIQFKISDNIDTAGKAKPIQFNGYIDGNWVLFEYDAKSATLTHYFEENLAKGEHLLKIELIDDRKNTSIFEQKFKKQ
jgi:hypothetical protein